MDKKGEGVQVAAIFNREKVGHILGKELYTRLLYKVYKVVDIGNMIWQNLSN